MQLSLLSPQESVEMLMYMAGVSADADAEVSAELIQISQRCGRYMVLDIYSLSHVI